MIFLALILFFLSPVFSQTEKAVFSVNGKKMISEVKSKELIIRCDSPSYDEKTLEAKGYFHKAKLSDKFCLVSFSKNSVMSASGEISALGLEVYANKVYRVKTVPNDTSLATQYHLSKISAYSAWEYETGFSSKTTIAIIDTGINSTHADLAAKVLPSGNVSISADGSSGPTAENPPVPACYHGSAVAGAAAADTNNSLGIAGVSWGANLISVKIFNFADCTSDCSDKNINGCVTSDAAIIKAVNYVKGLHNTATYGKIIANMSLGGAGLCSGAVQSEINDAYLKGIIMVAAAGNDSPDVNSPANCANVIPVSSTDENDNLSWFSSRGSAMLNGVAAPGSSIYTTMPPSTYVSFNGTSFASPIVSGLVSLMWSFKPEKTNAQIIDILKKTADDLGERGPDYSYGCGRINAFRSLLYFTDNFPVLSAKNKITAFPNPFYVSKDKIINFVIPAEVTTSDMKIKIFDFNGDLISEVKSYNWDGKNSSGMPVASGPYIVSVKTSLGSAMGKILLIR